MPSRISFCFTPCYIRHKKSFLFLTREDLEMSSFYTSFPWPSFTSCSFLFFSSYLLISLLCIFCLSFLLPCLFFLFPSFLLSFLLSLPFSILPSLSPFLPPFLPHSLLSFLQLISLLFFFLFILLSSLCLLFVPLLVSFSVFLTEEKSQGLDEVSVIE